MTEKDLLQLCSLYSSNQGVTHWAVSWRIFKGGGFFSKLQAGKSCTVKTAKRVSEWFSNNWPNDLPWPEDIKRPQQEVT